MTYGTTTYGKTLRTFFFHLPGLPASSDTPPAGSEALSASSDALQVGFEALQAGF